MIRLNWNAEEFEWVTPYNYFADLQPCDYINWEKVYTDDLP